MSEASSITITTKKKKKKKVQLNKIKARKKMSGKKQTYFNKRFSICSISSIGVSPLAFNLG